MAGTGGESGPGPGMQITPTAGEGFSVNRIKSKKKWFEKRVIAGFKKTSSQGTAPMHGKLPVITNTSKPEDISGIISDEVFFDKEGIINDGISISLEKEILGLSAFLVIGRASNNFNLFFQDEMQNPNIRYMTNISEGLVDGGTVKILIYAGNFPTTIPQHLFYYRGELIVLSVQAVSWKGDIYSFDIPSHSETFQQSSIQFDSSEDKFDDIGKKTTYNNTNEIKLTSNTQNNLITKPNEYYNENGVNYTGEYHKDVIGNAYSEATPSKESFSLYLRKDIPNNKDTSQQSSSSTIRGGY